MILLYQKYTEPQFKEMQRTAKTNITKWFKDHPRRKVCKAEIFYGKVVPIRRDHIDEDIQAAADAAR